MRSFLKKGLALLLVAVLTAGVLPVSAFAGDGEPEMTEESAPAEVPASSEEQDTGTEPEDPVEDDQPAAEPGQEPAEEEQEDAAPAEQESAPSEEEAESETAAAAADAEEAEGEEQDETVHVLGSEIEYDIFDVFLSGSGDGTGVHVGDSMPEINVWAYSYDAGSTQCTISSFQWYLVEGSNVTAIDADHVYTAGERYRLVVTAVFTDTYGFTFVDETEAAIYQKDDEGRGYRLCGGSAAISTDGRSATVTGTFTGVDSTGFTGNGDTDSDVISSLNLDVYDSTGAGMCVGSPINCSMTAYSPACKDVNMSVGTTQWYLVTDSGDEKITQSHVLSDSESYKLVTTVSMQTEGNSFDEALMVQLNMIARDDQPYTVGSVSAEVSEDGRSAVLTCTFSGSELPRPEEICSVELKIGKMLVGNTLPEITSDTEGVTVVSVDWGSTERNAAGYKVEALEEDQLYAPQITLVSARGYAFADTFDAALTISTDDTEIRISEEGMKSSSAAEVTCSFHILAKYLSYEYSITYELNGGTNNEANPSGFSSGSAVTLQNPTRQGYTFAGWYTDSAFKNKITKITAGTANDVTLYAKWTANTYTLVFNANGGKGTTKSLSVKYDGTAVLPANRFTRTGYYFFFWSTEDGDLWYQPGDPVPNELLDTAVNGKVTLYAVWNANECAVVFDANGGEGDSYHQYITYDVSTALYANEFTREGARFKCWNTRADGKGTSYADGQIVKNLTSEDDATVYLYAQWMTEDCYNIVFDPGTAGSSAVTGTTGAMTGIAENKTVTLTANGYAAQGYTFAGWKVENSTLDPLANKAKVSGSAFAEAAAAGNGTVTLTAQWTPNTYTVTYNGNGGSYIDSAANKKVTGCKDPRTFTYDKPYDYKENEFSRTGYTFTGWNTKANGKGTHYDPYNEVLLNLTAAANGKVTLYAEWEANVCRVYFNEFTGSEWLPMGVQELAYNKSAKLTAVSDMKNIHPAGYTFKGWAVSEENADAGKVTYKDTASVKNLASEYGAAVNLYAVWSLNTGTVKFNLNGVKGTSLSPLKNVNCEEKVLLPEAESANSGYTFKGWNTKADGTGISYGTEEDTVFYPAKNGETITLYAMWDYRVTYNSNYGNEHDLTVTMHYNRAQALNVKFTRTGYTLVGWNTNADKAAKGQARYKAGASVKNLPVGATLYAAWKVNTYTVTFNGNGADSGKMSTCTYTYGKGSTLAANAFKRTGYAFAGWNTKADGSGMSYSDKESVDHLTASGKVTLYAQWTKMTAYTIVFYGCGADSGSMASVECYQGQSFRLPKNTFKRDGYFFVGWFLNPDGKGDYYDDCENVGNNDEFFSNAVNGVITLYAGWEEL